MAPLHCLIGAAFFASLVAPSAAINYLVAGCVEQTSRVINCENLELTEIPEGIPSGFTKLLAKNNLINDNTGTELVRCSGNASACGSGILTSAQMANGASHPTLTELQLQGNGILDIADDAFTGYGGLDILRLFGNSIQTIQSGALNHLTQLSTLYINNNPLLTTIQSGAFSAFSSTLSELFLKDSPRLIEVEDGGVNALTFRPLFIDMTNGGTLCLVNPDGNIECACASSGIFGGSDGYCEASDAPTPSPTSAPITSAPVTSAPVTPAPVTASPVSVASTVPLSTLPAESTVAATTVVEATEENRQGDGGDTNVNTDSGMGKKAKKAKSGENGDGSDRVENQDAAPKKGKKAKSGVDDSVDRVDGQDATSAPKQKKEKKAKSGEVDGGADRVDGSGEDRVGSGLRVDLTTKAAKVKKNKAAKLSELGNNAAVSFQPWGDMQANVQLDGASSGRAVLISSAVVVLAVGAALLHRRNQKVQGYDLEDNERTFIAAPENRGPPYDPYSTFEPSPNLQ